MWLPSWTFYGVVPEADDSLINFTLTIRRSWHLNIRFLSFTRCVVQHIGLSRKFSLDPFQYWGIWSAPGGSSLFIGVMKLLYDIIGHFFVHTDMRVWVLLSCCKVAVVDITALSLWRYYVARPLRVWDTNVTVWKVWCFSLIGAWSLVCIRTSMQFSMKCSPWPDAHLRQRPQWVDLFWASLLSYRLTINFCSARSHQQNVIAKHFFKRWL